jgi:hypothetical protein
MRPRGLFEETFHAVKAAFGVLFTRLFGGGSAELVLSNPNDLLEVSGFAGTLARRRPLADPQRAARFSAGRPPLRLVPRLRHPRRRRGASRNPDGRHVPGTRVGRDYGRGDGGGRNFLIECALSFGADSPAR